MGSTVGPSPGRLLLAGLFSLLLLMQAGRSCLWSCLFPERLQGHHEATHQPCRHTVVSDAPLPGTVLHVSLFVPSAVSDHPLHPRLAPVGDLEPVALVTPAPREPEFPPPRR